MIFLHMGWCCDRREQVIMCCLHMMSLNIWVVPSLCAILNFRVVDVMFLSSPPSQQSTTALSNNVVLDPFYMMKKECDGAWLLYFHSNNTIFYLTKNSGWSLFPSIILCEQPRRCCVTYHHRDHTWGGDWILRWCKLFTRVDIMSSLNPSRSFL